jgi:hypothetical protein
VLSVKAIHLEVISVLSTKAFLVIFYRFTARRGIPIEIRSDCGTNNVSAARQLKSLFNKPKTRDNLLSKITCQWYFNPPAASYFGGI